VQHGDGRSRRREPGINGRAGILYVRDNAMKLSNLLLTLCVAAAPLMAQRNEVGLTLGRVLADEKSSAVELGPGTAFQVNYGRRLAGSDAVAVYGEVHFLASPQRKVETSIPAAGRDVASLYVTPGVRVKFAPDRRLSPWGAIGGGYGLYEHSDLTVGGAANPAARLLHRGVFMFGGGLDAKVFRWFDLRFEARDFYSGRADLNVPLGGGGQHNVVVGGGFVLKF
jgi:hypothetical protein